MYARLVYISFTTEQCLTSPNPACGDRLVINSEENLVQQTKVMSAEQNNTQKTENELLTAKSPGTARRVESSFDIRTMGGSAGASGSEHSLTSQFTAARQKTSHRFLVSLLTLCSVNLILIVTGRMVLVDSTLCRMLASLIVPVVAFFVYEWSFIHSSGLTRKCRAFWNESNILQTYQPRARFEGHKFKPDPPTPGPNMPPLLEGGCMGSAPHEQEDETAKSQREAFEASRTAHYANEFALALKGRAASPLPDCLRVDAHVVGSPIGPDEGLRPVSPEELPTNKIVPKKEEKAEKPDFKPPEKKNEAATKDPQYQTLVGLSSEAVFGQSKSEVADEAKGNAAPVESGNPQYETLTGLDNDEVFQKKGDPDNAAPEGENKNKATQDEQEKKA